MLQSLMVKQGQLSVKRPSNDAPLPRFVNAFTQGAALLLFQQARSRAGIFEKLTR
jgi:hypothetical protein